MIKKSPNRIVAIDYGIKRMGLSISDENQKIALPWTTITGGVSELISKLQSRKEEIKTILIGLPLLMNGAKGEMAICVEKFAQTLQETLQLPVVLVDERLSSKHAEASLRETGASRKKNSEKTDQVAAALLLESYLQKNS